MTEQCKRDGLADWRMAEAQRLFAELAGLTPGSPAYKLKLIGMARLHEARALELLQVGDPDGWIDFYAAVTAWAKAGALTKAKVLLEQGHMLALPFACTEISGELAVLAGQLGIGDCQVVIASIMPFRFRHEYRLEYTEVE